ncbi:MAG: ABC transporter permease [Deferribacteres bacterium]|nr:ABC transporter permease [Deferribacteres bacterium]
MAHQVKDIPLYSMVFVFLTLAVPVALYIYLKIRLVKELLTAAFRMAVQLTLMGIYLKYLFAYDNALVNVGWLCVMIVAATFQAVKSSRLNKRLFFAPVFFSYLFTIYMVTLAFNAFVINIKNVFSAKYFIVIGGMILGNSLRGVIISVSDFYKTLSREKDRLIYRVVTLGSFFEALIPYIGSSLELSVKPIIATMATMGIVSIPGMMTGQILGGASPLVAVKYQMAIVIAVFVSVNVSVILCLFITKRFAFDEYGNLKSDVFEKGRG